MRDRSPPSSLTAGKVVWALAAGMIACSTCASALPTSFLNPKNTYQDLQRDQIGQASSPLGLGRMSGKIVLSESSTRDFATADEDDADNDENDNNNDNYDYNDNDSYNDNEIDGDNDDDNDDRRYREMNNYQDLVNVHDPTAVSRHNHPSHRYALQRNSILDDPIPAEAQVLHQCTTHFAGLLQTQVSDHLAVKLSRFVRMLPVLGDDIKTVLVDEVETIMEQILLGLVRYENVHRVIKTAVDDSGLHLLAGNDGNRGENINSSAPSSSLWSSRKAIAGTTASSPSFPSLKNSGAESGELNSFGQNAVEDDDDAIEQEGPDDSGDDDERTAYSRYNSLFEGVDENEEEDSSLAGGAGGKAGEELSAQLWSYDSVAQDPYEREEDDKEPEDGARDSGDTSNMVTPPRRFWKNLASRWRSADEPSNQAFDDPSTAVLARIEPLASQRYYRANRNKIEKRYDDEDDEQTTSGENVDTEADASEGQIDESQIPAIAEIAMDAVIDYTAEVLHPTLVIHEISNALQEALRTMKKSRRLRQQQQELESSRYQSGYDDGEESDLSMMVEEKSRYGNNRSTMSDHELDLLGDEWVWSQGEENEDRETVVNGGRLDEDLWDQELEVQDWDETGRLFEMDDDQLDSGAIDASMSAAAAADPTSSEQDDSWFTEDDGSQYPVGIQDDDEGDEDEEDNNNDDVDGNEADQEYTSPDKVDGDDGDQRSSHLGRGLFENTSEADADIDGEEDDSGQALILGLRRHISQKRSYISSQGTLLAPPPVLPSLRRLNGAHKTTSDPTLEGLLSQLIEPILNNFINYEFPASCQRTQGELMDAIIWSLDQKDDDVEADQLALFAELEY
ncbi:hypothetical protein BGZ73_007247 [Actinomortierella ambigua]|nr:hypothetical protein BGZ73_007247 [Actinomortierella ambigua]